MFEGQTCSLGRAFTKYGIDPAARNEFSPSRFVLVYARVWHSVKWLENVRYATLTNITL